MQQCFPFLGDLLIKCGYFLFFKLTMQTIAYKGLIFYYLNKSFDLCFLSVSLVISFIFAAKVCPPFLSACVSCFLHASFILM